MSRAHHPILILASAVVLSMLGAGCGSASPPAVAERVGSSSTAPAAQPAARRRTGRSLHLEYIFNDGPVSVYDIDHGFKLVESFSLPATRAGVRGVAVSPRTHIMFVSYGGDGGGN